MFIFPNEISNLFSATAVNFCLFFFLFKFLSFFLMYAFFAYENLLIEEKPKMCRHKDHDERNTFDIIFMNTVQEILGLLTLMKWCDVKKQLSSAEGETRVSAESLPCIFNSDDTQLKLLCFDEFVHTCWKHEMR